MALGIAALQVLIGCGMTCGLRRCQASNLFVQNEGTILNEVYFDNQIIWNDVEGGCLILEPQESKITELRQSVLETVIRE